MIDMNTSSVNTSLSRKLMIEKNNFNALVLQRTSRQIDKPLGKLLPAQDPISALATGVVDIGKDAKNLVNTLAKGKSNDHELGKMNDLGLKLGGLSIASYLLTRRTTKTTKLMELAGFGTFFSMMALWPKLFIELPLKARFGFDVGQKYQDSQGRKKEFFQDNQYQPWDLWSDKQINKVADRMGVDKNMKDREEFTKKKMQKVALQARTSWMLSAGLATPLLASMVAGYIEKQSQPVIVKNQLDKSKKALLSVNEQSLKAVQNANFDKENLKELRRLMAEYSGKAPDDNFYSQAAKLINPAYVLKGAVDPDTQKILKEVPVNTINDEIKSAMKTMFIPERNVVPLDEMAEKLSSIFKEVETIDFDGSVKKATLSVDKIKSWFEGELVVTPEDFEKKIYNMGLKPSDDTVAKTLQDMLDSFKPNIDLDSQYKKVEDLYMASKTSKAKFKIFEEFANSLAGSKAESYHTKVFKGISDEFMRGLCPSFADLNEARKSPEAAYKIASKIINDLAEGIGPKGTRGTHESFLRSCVEKVDAICNENSDAFEKKLEFLKKNIGDESKYASLEEFNKAFASASKSFINFSKTSLDNSSLRLIMALDLERRIKAAGSDFDPKVGEAARKIIYHSTLTDIAESCGYMDNEPFYKKTISFLFGEKLDDSVVNALKSKNPKTSIVDRLNAARKSMMDVYSNPKVCDSMSPSVAHATVGEPVAEFFMKAAKEGYNNKLWMRIFGGATVAVVGLTLLSQMFFGRMKKEEKLYSEKGVNNAAK